MELTWEPITGSKTRKELKKIGQKLGFISAANLNPVIPGGNKMVLHT